MQDDISLAYEAFSFLQLAKNEGSHAGLMMLEALFVNEYSQIEGEFKIEIYNSHLSVDLHEMQLDEGYDRINEIEESVQVLYPLLESLRSRSAYSHRIYVKVNPNGVIQINS